MNAIQLHSRNAHDILNSAPDILNSAQAQPAHATPSHLGNAHIRQSDIAHSAQPAYDIVSFPSIQEEIANAQTHFGGIILTLLLSGPLIMLSLSKGWPYVLGTSLFVVGMFLMYLSSTLYHAVTHIPTKKRLRIFDHSSIYIMIAGSYSVICTGVLGGWMGWGLFAFLWICTIIGIVGKFIALGKHPRLSLVLYLLMGWVALLVIVPLWQKLSHLAFAFVLAEGLAYTIGAYFFKNDEKHAYYHAIWHIFILLGSIFHLLAVMLILVEPA